jgi:DNA primase
MARIPQAEIERLKRDVALADVCARYGLELKPEGNDLIACCPFHEEDSASFHVTPGKNLWHCFGCNAGGDNIQFVMKKDGVSFRHAVEKLQQIGGSAPMTSVIKTSRGHEHPVLVDPTEAASDHDVLQKAVDYYHQKFLDRPEAMQYLQKRGVFHPQAVKLFRIGYADRTLGYRVPPPTTATGRAMKAQLQRIGILRKTGHEHLTGCVVFPVWECWPDGQTGRITEIYGRRITPPVRDAKPHLYLSGPHGGVWNEAGLKGERVWLLCESILDALSFWVHDWHHVTASYGTNGFTPDHWKLLRDLRPDKIVLCYDNDEAGNKAANELAQQLEPEGFEAWRVELPAHSDVNDLIRATEDPKSALGALLAGAVRLLPGNVTLHPATLTQEPLLAGLPTESAPDAIEEQPASEPPPLLAADSPVFALNAEGTRAEYAEGDRSYRVLGLEHNTSFDHLKINLRLCVARATSAPVFYFETLDLYNARARAAFVGSAHQQTGVEKATLEKDLNQLIGRLETHQEKQIIQKMQAVEAAPVLTTEEESEVMALLRHPRLLDHVLADLHKCGLVGEDTNLVVAWLVSVSRKLDRPLGVCVMSRSAAGKSSLLEAVGRIIPDEDKHQYTALTPQALFHMPEKELQHKALFVAEDVGAEGAAYSLKTMQSDGQLIMACTTKDEATGQMMTKTKLVRGPVAVFLTSTSRSIDDELLNRLLVLSIDESPEQTQRIHQAQRYARSLEGIMERRVRPRIVKRQQNLQRLIRPLLVRNPFREELTFNSTRLRSRREPPCLRAVHAAGVAGHQHDGDEVAFVAQPRRHVEARHQRHLVIGQEQIERPVLQQLQRLGGPVALRGLMIEHGQHERSHARHRGLIVENQNAGHRKAASSGREEGQGQTRSI